MSANGRVALVTGGAVRLGRAMVEELARAGWTVAFSYRTSAAQAKELVEASTRAGQAVASFSADLDDTRERTRLLDEVQGLFGGLDALVNNAAVFPRTPLAELDEGKLRAVMRTNLEAPLFLAIAAAPLLRERRGAVVNVADVYGRYPLRNHLAYSISKAALVAATRGLAVELAPDVRVNAVAPGVALFPDHYGQATRDRLLRRTLLRREAGAAEIARTVRFVLEEARTMTGQVLVVDGGQTVALGGEA